MAISKIESITPGMRSPQSQAANILLVSHDENSFKCERKQFPPPYRYREWALKVLSRLNPKILFVDLAFDKRSDDDASFADLVHTINKLNDGEFPSEDEGMREPVDILLTRKSEHSQSRFSRQYESRKYGIQLLNENISIVPSAINRGFTNDYLIYMLKNPNTQELSPALYMYHSLNPRTDKGEYSGGMDIVWHRTLDGEEKAERRVKPLFDALSAVLSMVGCNTCSNELIAYQSEKDNALVRTSIFFGTIKELLKPDYPYNPHTFGSELPLDTGIITEIMPARSNCSGEKDVYKASEQDADDNFQLNSEAQEFLLRVKSKLAKRPSPGAPLVIIYSGSNTYQGITPIGSKSVSMIHGVALEELLERGENFRISAMERTGNPALQVLYLSSAVLSLLLSLAIWKLFCCEKTLALSIVAYGLVVFIACPVFLFSSCVGIGFVIISTLVWVCVLLVSLLHPRLNLWVKNTMAAGAVCAGILVATSLGSYIAVDHLNHGPSIWFTFLGVTFAGSSWFISGIYRVEKRS